MMGKKYKLSARLMVLIDKVKKDDKAKRDLFSFASTIDEQINDIYTERTLAMSTALSKFLAMQGDIGLIERENHDSMMHESINLFICKVLASEKWSGSYSDLISLTKDGE